MADPVNVLKLAGSYSSERESSVWNSLDDNLRTLYTLYQSTDFIANFQKFLIELYTPLMEYVGWDAGKGEGNVDLMY